MALNILETVALAYQPIWGAQRQLIGVRLRVRALQPESFNAAQFLQLLSDEWSVDAPFLLVSLADPSALHQALALNAHDHIWLELPDEGERSPAALTDAIVLAYRMGHRLVQEAPLARAKPVPAVGQGQHRYLLHLWPEQATAALQAAEQRALGQPSASPMVREQLYRGIGSTALAAHCLDDRSAWGICEWPVEDALKPYRRHGVPVDKRTLVRLQQALMREASMDTIENLILQDAVLTFRMMRLVNSPVFGTAREVTTVRQALMLLGQVRLKNWLLELMPGASADRDLLPVRLAMVLRARLMAQLMEAGLQRDLNTEIYLTGLFSQLDRLMQEPLTQALRRIPLSEAVSDALLHDSGTYFIYLELARRLERHDEVQRLPAFCDASAFPLDHVNKSLIRALANWRNTI